MLVKQKEAREKYEVEAAELTKQILLIRDLHMLYDGDFLEQLKQFTNAYKRKQDS